MRTFRLTVWSRGRIVETWSAGKNLENFTWSTWIRKWKNFRYFQNASHSIVFFSITIVCAFIYMWWMALSKNDWKTAHKRGDKRWDRIRRKEYFSLVHDEEIEICMRNYTDIKIYIQRKIFYYSDKVFDFLAQHVYTYMYFLYRNDAEFGIIIEASWSIFHNDFRNHLCHNVKKSHGNISFLSSMNVTRVIT